MFSNKSASKGPGWLWTQLSAAAMQKNPALSHHLLSVKYTFAPSETPGTIWVSDLQGHGYISKQQQVFRISDSTWELGQMQQDSLTETAREPVQEGTLLWLTDTR